ncbi:MAG: DUF4198 domain-containing protein [Pseudomonadales bacterium]|nr:DUF4198 domain-containing protein [Pseudomonadales bacterium]
MRKLIPICLAILFLTRVSPCLAHTVWLERDERGGFAVLFGGHAGALEPLEPEKLRYIMAMDADGQSLDVERLEDTEYPRVLVPDSAVLVAAHYDNGIWSRDRMGRSVNLPMNETRGAHSATLALKYHKTVLDWTERVTRPLGQAFEVVPVTADRPVAGEVMLVRVLLNGEPASGVALGHGEAGDAGPTDARGIAGFVPEAGFNRLWAGKRLAVETQTHTEVSYEYLMGFEALPSP